MKKIIFASLLTFVMIGCGGSSEPTEVVKNIQLKGVASDDLIVNGIVKAYGANDSSKTILDEGRTSNTDGSYILDVAYDGVIVVEVTCDSASRMLTPSGNKIDCAPNLELHSAAAVTPTSGSVKVNISPLTEAVVQRMETLGSADIKPEHLQTASQNIKDMFGVDPVVDNPLEGDYSGIIASFHEVAKNTTGKTITDVINEIAEDLKDGEAGDSNLTKGLAQKMKDQNLTNNIADNNGTFDPVTNALAFTSDELVGHTFYLVENVDFGKLEVNATHTKWTNMLNEDEYDTNPYVIEDGKLKFADGSTIERFVKTANYSVVRPVGESINIFLFDSENAAKSKISQLSANFAQEVQDSQTDSKKSHTGFELTSLTTTIVDDELVIKVKTKGDIQNALDTVANTTDYANILWIGINNYYEFGLMAGGSHYMVKQVRADGEFEGEINGTVAGYTYSLLPGNKGVELYVPLASLDRIDNIFTSTLIVRAEVAEDDTTDNEEGEENDENSYDKIETFVTLKTIPITHDMFDNKTFYNSWIEDGQTVYNKIQTSATDINSTEQKGDQITPNNGTFTISNGKVHAVMDDGNSELSVLDLKADHVTVMYKGDNEIGIEPWYFAKPAGFPSFIQGEGNHAPTISLVYPPITLAGISLPMKMVDFNDSDQDALTMGITSLPSSGTLQVNGENAAVGQTIALSNLQSVVYIPTDDFNGTVTSEINVTDGIDTATKEVNITVLDKSNTLSIPTLDGKTFYTRNTNDDNSINYNKVDFNTTHITVVIKNFTVADVNETVVIPYEISSDSKVLTTDEEGTDDDMTAYLLKIVDLPDRKLWKFGAEYDNGDKSIEIWYTSKPAGFPF